MKDIIKKAAVLVEAMPYIQEFRGSIVVIKFGGSAMEEKEHSDGILQDVVFMECIGMLPVIVHGGGKAISRSMKDSGLHANFLNGLRVTCEKTIEIVKHVFQKEVNPHIVETLATMGGRAEGVQGETVFTASKKTGQDPETGEALDWGFVGEPVEVNAAAVQKLIKKNVIPVITPLGLGVDGKVHNMNADTAAAAMAKTLGARKLVFVTDVPGLLKDKDDPGSIMSTLHAKEVEYLVTQGVIDGGMLPKVSGGVDALHNGVRKVHMIDGRMQHSLLLEIFTDEGVGTEIISDDA